jgi:hypothetical protein
MPARSCNVGLWSCSKNRARSNKCVNPELSLKAVLSAHPVQNFPDGDGWLENHSQLLAREISHRAIKGWVLENQCIIAGTIQEEFSNPTPLQWGPINPSIYRGGLASPPNYANRFNGFFPTLQ